MTIYMAALPSIVAILIKVTVIYFAATSKKSNAFLWLVAMFFVNNIAELLIFFGEHIGVSPDQAMRLYYVSILFVMLFMCNYAVHISRNQALKITLPPAWLLYVTAALLIVASNAIINGAKPLLHGHTADKGEFYIIYTLLALYTILFTFSTLFYSYKKTKKHELRVQCGYSLIALSSFLVIGLAVVVLMALGFKINALSALPFGTTFFVLINLFTEQKHKTTDIRSFLPGTLEYQTVNRVTNIMAEYASEGKDHSDALFEIKKVMSQHRKDKENGEMIKAMESASANSSYSMLYQKLKNRDFDK